MATKNTDPVILKIEGSVPELEAELKRKSRQWAFTLNNYTEDDIAQIATMENCMIRCGKETGASGTPHLQGYIELKNAASFQAIKKRIGIPRIHVERTYKCRTANLKYCSKEGDLIRDDFPHQIIYQGEDLPTELFPWELTLLSMLSKPKTSNRQLIWIVDTVGNSGKSTFGKYLEYHRKDVCYTRISKSNDILTAAGSDFSTYYFDFPRSLGGDFCPFTALECILDGVVDDCKLKKEPRRLRFKPPWVVVVSNHYPNTDKLSSDSWSIYTIEEQKLHEVKTEKVRYITYSTD